MKRTSSFLIGALGILVALVFAFIIAKTGSLAILLIPIALVGIFLVYFILRNPEFGWYLIVFFLPFERVPSLQLFGVNLKINTVIGFITLFCWVLALAFNPKKFKIQPNFLSIPLLLFFFAMVLSLTQALN